MKRARGSACKMGPGIPMPLPGRPEGGEVEFLQESEWEEELREEDEDLRKVLRKQRTKAVRDGEMFWSQPVPQGLEMEKVSVLVYACADGHL